MPNSEATILGKRPAAGFHGGKNAKRMSTDAGCSSDNFVLSDDTPLLPIIEAIFTGNGS